MSFIEFVKKPAAGKANAHPLNASLTFPNKSTIANLTLTLTEPMVGTLGWNSGSMIRVQLGVGDDQGKLRLCTDQNGLIELKQRALPHKKNGEPSGYFYLSLGHVEQFVNRRELSQPCSFEKKGGGWIEVNLPPWAKEKPGPVSDGSMAAVLKSAPQIKLDWHLQPLEEDLVRYLLASKGHAAQRLALLDVARVSDVDIKTERLNTVLGNIRRKLDPAGCTIQAQSGGIVKLLGNVNALVAANDRDGQEMAP